MESYPFLSQYIGNIDNLSAMEFLRKSSMHLMKLARKKPDLIVCDLHPQFHSTILAKELAERFDTVLIRVQHHYAHLASLLAECGKNKMIGICCDGAGYGFDGEIWGGEIIAYIDGNFERVAHLEKQPMPGGDLSAIYPSRMLLGILSKIYTSEELVRIAREHNLRFRYGDDEMDIVIQQLERGVNTYITTSAGRFLDAVSALLGICYYRSYEGEPAMKLESKGNQGKNLNLDVL